MKRIAVTAASAALVLGSIGSALAAGMAPSAKANAGYSGTSEPGSMSSSAPIDRAGASYTHTLNLLEANGYTGIENFARHGEGFTATAIHNGKRVQVAVDPSGQIRNQG
jgi:hypothetical protein